MLREKYPNAFSRENYITKFSFVIYYVLYHDGIDDRHIIIHDDIDDRHIYITFFSEELLIDINLF